MTAARERVLVYDDDEHLRAAACVLLRAAAFDAHEFGDEESFMLALRREGASAVVVDFDAGVGYRHRLDIARLIREEKWLEPLVIVGVSHDVGWIDLDLVDFAISKPYVTAELPRLLRGMIDIAGGPVREGRYCPAVGGWRAARAGSQR